MRLYPVTQVINKHLLPIYYKLNKLSQRVQTQEYLRIVCPAKIPRFFEMSNGKLCKTPEIEITHWKD
ncbi:hypothetical protein [Thermodesulfobacterium hveragerdense]|uniref:hypothetical protein n=1 Tax=Thermodesulfobacterium hveragerdense TaxID=53424 RepID=UPI000429CE1E|nr:hypothetical protein [Thermodesulfobacterium hveragerdense]